MRYTQGGLGLNVVDSILRAIVEDGSGDPFENFENHFNPVFHYRDKPDEESFYISETLHDGKALIKPLTDVRNVWFKIAKCLEDSILDVCGGLGFTNNYISFCFVKSDNTLGGNVLGLNPESETQKLEILNRVPEFRKRTYNLLTAFLMGKEGGKIIDNYIPEPIVLCAGATGLWQKVCKTEEFSKVAVCHVRHPLTDDDVIEGALVSKRGEVIHHVFSTQKDAIGFELRSFKTLLGNPESFAIIYIPSVCEIENRTGLQIGVEITNDNMGRLIRLLSELVFVTRSWGLAIERQLLGARIRSNFIVQKKQLQEAYTQSAIGTIMSRNGSHNIGSHVLSALSHNVGTMPDDRMLYRYIQDRMAYVAQATTAMPKGATPVRIIGNLMKDFLSQRHLLEHIAGSEGLSAYHYQDRNCVGEQENRIKLIPRRVYVGNHKGLGRVVNVGQKDREYTVADVLGSAKVGDRINWQHDLPVAIPGGVIGNHAFYNIIENIIRNAAKHGWSSGHTVGNLEIYIDFIDRPEKGVVEFIVGDNVSDVFARADRFWEHFWEWLENGVSLLDRFMGRPKFNLVDVEKGLRDPLSSADEVEAVARYLDGKNVSVERLPVAYQAVCRYLEKNRSEFDLHGARLVMPLHHELQLKLAESFIRRDDNTLREGNWGLAEMKISAGFLQKRDIGEIGGLRRLKDGDAIITPAIMPVDDEDSERDKVLRRHYHLGYRFTVPKPKEMLILLKEDEHCPPDDGDIAKVFKQNGVFYSKGGEKLYDFEYIVVADGTPDPAMPFRVVDRPKDVDLLPVAATDGEVRRIKNIVYKAWLTQLSAEREIKNLPLTMSLQVSDLSSGGEGKGLVSQRDILEALFKECFHSIVLSQTVSRTNEDEKSALMELAETVISDDNLLNEESVQCYGSADKLGTVEKLVEKQLDNIINGLQDKHQAVLNGENLKAERERLKNRLAAAFETCRVFLSKYEERIVTLPKSFSLTKKQGGTVGTNECTSDACAKDRDIGVQIVRGKALIKFARHDNLPSGDEIYCESLSGSQSYLNAMDQLEEKGDDVALLAMMAETGIMRMLIIDERVDKFLAEREEMRSVFARMGIWAVNTKDCLAVEDIQPVSLKNTKPDFALEKTPGKYEIIIVHQGMIDKWIERQKREKSDPNVVHEILEQIKARYSCKRIVITTGRGRPANVPKDVKVIPFPSVKNYLFKRYPEKLLLVESIMTALPLGVELSSEG